MPHEKDDFFNGLLALSNQNQSWVCDAVSIPVPDQERVDLNLWLNNPSIGLQPGANAEIVIERFDFTPSVDGDWDGDGDIDVRDFAKFALCFSGSSDQPGYVAPTDDCRRVFDFDGDGDVDNYDFAAFHAGMTGP